MLTIDVTLSVTEELNWVLDTPNNGSLPLEPGVVNGQKQQQVNIAPGVQLRFERGTVPNGYTLNGGLFSSNPVTSGLATLEKNGSTEATDSIKLTTQEIAQFSILITIGSDGLWSYSSPEGASIGNYIQGKTFYLTPGSSAVLQLAGNPMYSFPVTDAISWPIGSSQPPWISYGVSSWYEHPNSLLTVGVQKATSPKPTQIIIKALETLYSDDSSFPESLPEVVQTILLEDDPTVVNRGSMTNMIEPMER